MSPAPSAAVVGCGYWGATVLRNFLASGRFRLVMAVDRDPRRLSELAVAHPSLALSTALGDALAAGADLIVIATPPGSHHGLGLEALRAGRHVLIEKPMALSLRECRGLNAAAREADRRIFVDHTELFSGPVQGLRRLIGEGVLGEVRRISSLRANPSGRAAAPDVLWDLGPHDFSIASHLLGNLPVSVSAASPGGDARDVEVGFAYPDGVSGRFRFNASAAARERSLTVEGRLGTAAWRESEGADILRLYSAVDRATDRDPAGTEINVRKSRKPLEELADHLFEVLTRGGPSPIDGEEGEKAVALVEAARSSFRLGGKSRRIPGAREPRAAPAA